MDDRLANLHKFSVAQDQFGDGMTIVPQPLLAWAASEIERLEKIVIQQQLAIGNSMAKETLKSRKS